MEGFGSTPRRRKFSLASLRVLKGVEHDEGYSELQPKQDLTLLLAFLERFNDLGWLPPLTAEKRRLLEQYGVIMHEAMESVAFYELCAKGGRGERVPWLTIFFHVSEPDGVVRICGVPTTAELQGKRRIAVVARIRNRVIDLARAIERRSPGR